jgi:hypothetical protein
MHPMFVILIYAVSMRIYPGGLNDAEHTITKLSPKPETVTIAYTELERDNIVKNETDSAHVAEWMEIDYSIRGE